jgi:hypothetical protein
VGSIPSTRSAASIVLSQRQREFLARGGNQVTAHRFVRPVRALTAGYESRSPAPSASLYKAVKPDRKQAAIAELQGEQQ